ncbi:MAG TPA: hypothetical protein PLL25_02610 [Flavobacteriales bacterium]|jgi:hypothetical protein|nr:hypothetical protein [Flavobacteriales bacterium]
MRALRHWRDRLNHEYWPWQLIHLPVIPAALWHALRSGHGAFFTNVNPAIDLGGFFGERKHDILARLPQRAYPTTVLVQPDTPWTTVQQSLRDAELSAPLILKPDVGERGEGVTLVANEAELQRLLAACRTTQLVQRLVPWQHEYGLFFLKDPHTGRTRLLSIATKAFLAVQGDGRTTVEDLLRRTFRGSKQLPRLRTYRAALLATVPASGERVVVEPIGNHCRGTTFLDGGHLLTEQLERAVDELLADTTGIHYGRLDVRAPDDEALQQGRFLVMELNGVTSEPGHIYDPTYTIFRCWRELLRHVAHIPTLSAALRAQGHPPASLRTLWQRYRSHFATR